ncbi:MAG: hypothetical protein KZQ78_11810 [Candidatus Thiodiazotropha sp. (ex Ustalcina ferruginea)]|nr:hypothetical protein [Candidatus Thiodiazotropha sp. (ex Ustalcina ferruginea)]
MMMRKKLLAAAVAAGILAPITSHAVNVSLDGSGQSLLYPYYNVNDGNVTFLSVTNTTDVAKAIKVRFREGAGSEDVFDITVYLSAEDVWVAAVSRDGDSITMSIPEDSSCTVPSRAVIESVAFNPTRIPAEYTENIPNRLSEGHIEIIEMAELPNTPLENDITVAITHDQTASPPTPVDCTVPVAFSGAQTWAILDDTVVGGFPVVAGGVTQDFTAPGGGLIGNAAIFNPTSGIYYPYNATALNQSSANPIWWPQNAQEFQSITDPTTGNSAIAGSLDSAANAHTNYFSADDDAPLSNGNALNFDLPDLGTPSTAEITAGATANQYTTQAVTFNPTIKTDTFTVAASGEDNKRDAVTASLMGNTITGEYLTTGTFGTDWIVTFPTRYLHVTESVLGVGGAATAPFTTIQAAETGQACQEVVFDFWNREESQNAVNVDVGVSPGIPTPGVSLCYEVNVLAMNDSSAAGTATDVVGSITTAARFPLGANFADGWAQLGFGTYSLAGPVETFTGLPVVGFSAVNDVVSGTERGGVFPSRVTFDQTP